MKSLLVLAAFGVLGAGCSTLDQQANALSGAQPCCESLAQASFLALQLASPMPAEISDASPSYRFAEGKSYLAAFRLPANRPLGRILLKTHSTGFLASEPQVFCPALTLLDQQMRPISRTGEMPLHFEPPGLLRQGFWFAIAQLPADAAMVVVHTPAAVIGSVTRVSGNSPGYSYWTGSTSVYVPGGRRADGPPCGHRGRLELEIR
ncbi:MAG TPA: MalM family protein [Ramlibacter sp.]|nr:MalM family protein [Ramlibacter sp.]